MTFWRTRSSSACQQARSFHCPWMKLCASSGCGSQTATGLTLGTEASEGEKKLRSHFRRERSNRLRHPKVEAFLRQHGKYFCELCRDDGTSRYPESLAHRIFEVHHRQPLSLADAPVRTTLIDLAVLCASYHRAVHASIDVDRVNVLKPYASAHRFIARFASGQLFEQPV